MPCLSTGYDEEDTSLRDAERDIAKLEAALCSALTFIESNSLMTRYYSTTDWKEVGVNKEKVASWWENHKKKDARRRKDEARAAAKEKADQEKFDRLSELPWRGLPPEDQRFLATFERRKRSKVEDEV